MKKYFYLLLLPLCLGLGACGSDDDDDDDDDGKTNSLVDSRVVGTWTSTIGEGWTWDHGVLTDHWKDESATRTRNYIVVNGVETGEYTVYTRDEPEWTTVTFNADGTFMGSNDEESGITGSFTAQNGVLTYISMIGADQWNYSFEGTTMKLVQEEESYNIKQREINWYVKGLYQAGM